MATAAKKSPAAAKKTKPAQAAAQSSATKTAKPAAKADAKPAAKPASKPASSTAKAAPKARSKKVAPPPPEPVVYVSAYSVGHRVTHASFGDGKVTSITGDQLTIQFKAGEKVILDGFVKPGPKG